MLRSLCNKVVAIPFAATATGTALAKLLAAEDCALALGAPSSAQIRSLEEGVQGYDRAYALQVDLDRPKSVEQFFKIAVGQFGRLDAIVLEVIQTSPRRSSTEQIIATGARRLLHCLDAAFNYAEGELHVISIAPEAGRTAIPIATAFVGARFATVKPASVPQVRMSIVSPFEGQNAEDGALARTVIHVMREERSPGVAEMMLLRPRQTRVTQSKHSPARLKLAVPL